MSVSVCVREGSTALKDALQKSNPQFSAAVVRPYEISSLPKVNFMLNSKVNIMVPEVSKVKAEVQVSTFGAAVVRPYEISSLPKQGERGSE